MKNPKAQTLLTKIQHDLKRNGIIINTIIEDLKELRSFALEESNPLLVKVIRLTYEHIETYQTFDIPIPEDEPVEGFEEETAETQSTPQESLDYLLSLMMDQSKNKLNEIELRDYREALKTYAEEN